MLKEGELVKLFQQAVGKATVANKQHGRLGKATGEATSAIYVTGKPGRVFVTRHDQSFTEAIVKGKIVYEYGYPVEFVEEHGHAVILGKSVHPSLPVVVDTNRVIDLDDVDGTGLADQHLLYYDAVDGVWKVNDLATLAGPPMLPAGSPLSTDPGAAGEVRYDASYLYVCVAADTWGRVALTTGY